MSRIALIIGAHQAAIVVHMKIHGSVMRIANTPMPMRIQFKLNGQCNVATVATPERTIRMAHVRRADRPLLRTYGVGRPLDPSGGMFWLIRKRLLGS
jgi:hypothetical protein